jgi:hypothetical protein
MKKRNNFTKQINEPTVKPMQKTVEGSSLQSKHRKEKDEFYLPHHSHIHSRKIYSPSTVFE